MQWKCFKFAGKTEDFKSSNSTCKAGSANLILSSFPSIPPSAPLNSPHSNNCPPPSRKTLVPLENSITRLHKRFKIMRLSLCGERERTSPTLKQGAMLSHTGISGRYCIITYCSSCWGFKCSCFLQRARQSSTCLTGRLQTFRVSCVSVASQSDPGSCPACLIKQ